MTDRDGTRLRGRCLQISGHRLYARVGGPARPSGPPVVFRHPPRRCGARLARKGVANLRALLGGAHALSYGMPEAIARLVVGAVPDGGGM